MIISTPHGDVELTGAALAEFVASLPGPEAPQFSPLTARQLLLGLLVNGFTANHVAVKIEEIADPLDRATARIEWERTSQFERSHPLIAQVGGALGLSPEQIDAMWQQALGL